MNASLPVAEPISPHCEADLALRDDVHRYLARTGHRPLRLLSVDARDGVVLLRGTVPNFYLRQLAIACQQRVEGIRCLVDEVRTPGEE